VGWRLNLTGQRGGASSLDCIRRPAAAMSAKSPPSRIEREKDGAPGFVRGETPGPAPLSLMTKMGALPFSRSLREGGAFRRVPVTARLVDCVFQSEGKDGPAPEKGRAPAFVRGESTGQPPKAWASLQYRLS
jgi:hypothetical protein